jgi:hypothetical protein
MCLYSLDFIDRSGHVLDRRPLEAVNVSYALAQANRSLCTALRGTDRGGMDLKGRVDVVDEQGAAVARIYCADALLAMS